MEKFKRYAVERTKMFGLPIEHRVSPTGRTEDRHGIKLHHRPTNNNIFLYFFFLYGTTADPGSSYHMTTDGTRRPNPKVWHGRILMHAEQTT